MKEQVLNRITELSNKVGDKVISPEYLAGILRDMVNEVWRDDEFETVSHENSKLHFSKSGNLVQVTIVDSNPQGGKTMTGYPIPEKFRPQNDLLTRDFSVTTSGELSYRVSKVDPSGRFFDTFTYNVKQPSY